MPAVFLCMIRQLTTEGEVISTSLLTHVLERKGFLDQLFHNLLTDLVDPLRDLLLVIGLLQESIVARLDHELFNVLGGEGLLRRVRDGDEILPLILLSCRP